MTFEELSNILQPLVVLGGVVWAIAKIQGTADRLGDRIEQLGKALDKLDESLGDHKKNLDVVKERLIRLEGKLPI